MLLAHKGIDNKDLTDSPQERLQTSLQTKTENDLTQNDSIHTDVAEIVKAWPDLPEHIKQAMQALVRPYNEKEKG